MRYNEGSGENMKYRSVLVTGGVGFIGSFLTDALVAKGYTLRVLDNLEQQVHGGNKPVYLNPKATFIQGDVRDFDTVAAALDGVDVVYHLASRVGVAQSNYEISQYADTNVGGTANILDAIVNCQYPVKKVVLTASMTSYGEGVYACTSCGPVHPALRRHADVAGGAWEPLCPTCRGVLAPVATNEDVKMHNNSIYALTKNTQEEMLMLVGRLYGIPTVSLRCFNVYGPRQSLSNPYTGVAAIFISRLKNNKPPVVYEDGKQTRDFVSIHDVVRALILAMEKDEVNNETVNIGSGKPTSIYEIANLLGKLLEKDIPPTITGQFRSNDIRHCFADITKAGRLLSWRPEVGLEEGLAELIQWAKAEKAEDSFEKAEQELRQKNLL